jgi:hypothetical protein
VKIRCGHRTFRGPNPLSQFLLEQFDIVAETFNTQNKTIVKHVQLR